MLIAFRPLVVAIIMLIMVFFSPLVIARPVDAVRAVGPTWDRTYVPTLGGGQNSEQTRDGGFIMSAYGGWVMKANAAGMPEWQREYLPMGYGSASGIVTPTRDGGYVVMGAARSIGYVTGLDGWLLKLDRRGNVDWSKTYGGPNDDSFFSGRQTSDGGYIVAGNSQSFGSPYDVSNGWLLRSDPDGKILWQKVFASTDISTIEQTNDGGFVVAGAVGLLDHAALWVFELDPLGNMVWEKAYDFPQRLLNARNVVFHELVHQTSDGHFIVAAERVTEVFPGGYFNLSDTNILKLDREGSIVWQKVYSGGGGGFTTPISVDEMLDGGFLASGHFSVSRSGSGPSGPWLLRLDADGDLVWQKIYPGSFFSEAHVTKDGGIIAVGSCCGDFVWAMKLDLNGDVRGCPVGVASNGSLTETNSMVTDTTIISVDTNASVTPVDITVTTPTFPVKDQCMALPSKNEG